MLQLFLFLLHVDFCFFLTTLVLALPVFFSFVKRLSKLLFLCFFVTKASFLIIFFLVKCLNTFFWIFLILSSFVPKFFKQYIFQYIFLCTHLIKCMTFYCITKQVCVEFCLPPPVSLFFPFSGYIGLISKSRRLNW